MSLKRSELTSWLYNPQLDHYEDLPSKNPKIILTDGISELVILSVYKGEEPNTIYIDLGDKE